MSQPFGDIRTIPHAVELEREGLDPYRQQPGFTTMNYPRVWIWLFSMGHLNEHVVGYEIGVISLVLLCLSHLIYFTDQTLSAVAVLVASFSSAVLLLVERGNTDMVAFILIYVASQTAFAGLIVLAALLKLYPALALFPAALQQRTDRRWVGAGMLLIIAYVILTHADIRRIEQNTPHSFVLSYGVQFLAEGLERRWHEPFRTPLTVVSGVMGGLIGWWGWRVPRSRLLPKGSAIELFLMFSVIFVGTFVATPNFEYRLVFLIPTLPFWCELLAFEEDRPLAAVGLALTLVSMGSPLLHGWMPLRVAHHVAQVLLFALVSFFLGRVVKVYETRLHFRSTSFRKNDVALRT